MINDARVPTDACGCGDPNTMESPDRVRACNDVPLITLRPDGGAPALLAALAAILIASGADAVDELDATRMIGP